MLDPNEWTLLRIRRSTKAALERMRTSMEIGETMLTAEDREKKGFSRDASGRVGLDQVILRLIAFKDAHAERSRRSRSKRASKAKAGDQAAAGTVATDQGAEKRHCLICGVDLDDYDVPADHCTRCVENIERAADVNAAADLDAGDQAGDQADDSNGE